MWKLGKSYLFWNPQESALFEVEVTKQADCVIRDAAGNESVYGLYEVSEVVEYGLITEQIVLIGEL